MKNRSWGFLVGGLLVALLLAGVVSNYASSHPDGLDSSLLKGCTVDADDNIVGGSCPAQQAREHELGDSPLADYGVRGVGNDFLSTGLSGVLGVLLTFAIGAGGFWLLRRRGSGTPTPDDTTTPAEGTTPSEGDAATSRAGAAG
ncbi:cobalamin biosynthesis protein CbiM [Micromonospora acroterricola]|uniref:Cobalamin biosynthesis protein CbiM n=1 Tax=Micromonospora acroterricola TaxID=2202421 RepID=A0A317D1U1_9ACTN|nr:PDGLE domain-containing protein [Micromonospora acroterricola]PWR08659.1 cobalamin biosynthesis protein CbiM [Micromonospora acroterricola]